MNQNQTGNHNSFSSYFAADEQEEREQYLRVILYFVLFVTGSLTISHFTQKIPYTPLILGIYFLSIVPALKEEFRIKYYHFWSWHLILGAILVDGLTVIFTGGVNAPGLIWMVIIAAFCEVLFEGKRKLIPVSLIITSIILSRIGISPNWFPESIMGEEQAANIRMISTLLASTYMFFFMSLIRRNLNKKRQVVSNLSWKNVAYSSIFDYSDDMIGIADKDGKIIFHNRSFVERVGLDPTKEDAYVKDLHPDWAIKKVIEEGIPAAQKKGSWTGETAVKTRSGGVFPTLQTIIWTDDGTGQPITSTIIKDISILREREDNLKREVQARLVAEKDAEKASIEKSLFLANMSHEIRTPLHSIIGLSDILLEENKDDKNEKPLKTLNKASHHLLGRCE